MDSGRGEIGNSELPELTDLPKKFGYEVTQKIFGH